MPALADMRRPSAPSGAVVRSTGLVLIGEGYWKGEPQPDELAFLEAWREDHRLAIAGDRTSTRCSGSATRRAG